MARQSLSLAARYREPAVYAFRSFPQEGGLISYGGDLTGQLREELPELGLARLERLRPVVDAVQLEQIERVEKHLNVVRPTL